MRIAWCTDIHLDHLSEKGRAGFAAHLAASGCDAVILTGDLSNALVIRSHLIELSRAIARPIHFVLGNHDFYQGSIEAVRRDVAEVTRADPWLSYLPDAGVISIDADTVLVGCDGFGDGRLGRVIETPVVLNDHLLIRELAGLPRSTLASRLARLGDEEAARLAAQLAKTIHARRVIVATHVPPFRESAWHDGAPSNDDWLPFFSCKAVGDVLLEHARMHPQQSITVLCGHTHGAGVAEIDANLVVHTGAADYGRIAIAGMLDTTRPALL
jgi:3',5'-cyclic AMP phosphodiesterase CpdA